MENIHRELEETRQQVMVARHDAEVAQAALEKEALRNKRIRGFVDTLSDLTVEIHEFLGIGATLRDISCELAKTTEQIR